MENTAGQGGAEQHLGDRVRTRVWAQDVAVSAAALRLRVSEIENRKSPRSGGELRAIQEGVRLLVHRAECAAYGENPAPRGWADWWRGTRIEAAYQNLHAAEAQIIRLYDGAEVDAEIPEAVARVEASLKRDDSRVLAARSLLKPMAMGLQRRRELLSKTIDVGHEAVDRLHSRVRSFRNIVLATSLLLSVFVVTFVIVVASMPTLVPLCFGEGPGEAACPAGRGVPSTWDVAVVALLGLLGGTLAGAVSIRDIRGTSTPYDVPKALGLLKPPAGALTALGAIIAIRGEFVPGLSTLDSQQQILAYALVFGYAQQLLTGLIDAQGQSVLESIPSKDVAGDRQPLRDLSDDIAFTDKSDVTSKAEQDREVEHEREAAR